MPVVTASTIVRCKRCRTYINPFVTFLDQGVRWRCNMCFSVNDGARRNPVPSRFPVASCSFVACRCHHLVPSDFDYDLVAQTRIDRFKRPELTHGVLEFVAPTEYMVRPPQPPVYLFVIDVSYHAVISGTERLRALAGAFVLG